MGSHCRHKITLFVHWRIDMSNQNILSYIGNTPLIKLDKLCEVSHVDKNIYVKLEGENPGGSVKIRAALYCIEKAEKAGHLGANQQLVIEATNLNTAVGLAIVCAAKNYKLVIVMADTEDNKHYSLLHAYGVQVILTPGSQGLMGANKKADQLCKKYPEAYRPRLFYNTTTISAYRAIGREIWRDTDGKVDIIVAGVGSGATITGIAEHLKRKNKDIEVVAVEAEESQLLLGGKEPASHGIRGFSTDEYPPLINRKVIDEVYPVKSLNAFGGCVALAANDGILAGISSGAVVHAALQLARMPQNASKMIVAILPDTGERYLGTGLFDQNESYIVI